MKRSMAFSGGGFAWAAQVAFGSAAVAACRGAWFNRPASNLAGFKPFLRNPAPWPITVLNALKPTDLPRTSGDDPTSDLIRRTGARATPARVRVLRLLRSAPAPLTHHEIEQALGAPTIDRVTLYRVLDWLAASGLAHKNSDAARVFRFSAASLGEHSTHVHFRCESCGGVFCLDAPAPVPPQLPPGFVLARMDFDLRGRCAACAERDHAR